MRPGLPGQDHDRGHGPHGPGQGPQGQGAQAQKTAAHPQHDQKRHPEGGAGGNAQGERIGQGIQEEPLEDDPGGGQGGAHQPGEHHPGEADAPDDHLGGAVHGPGMKAQLAQDHGGDGAPAHVHAADARGQGHRGDQPQAQDQAGDDKPARPS